MKRFAWICRAALVIAGGLLAQPLRAVEEKGHPAKPLLWKIEGNGLEKPSYLFGTIHVSTPAIATLHPAYLLRNQSLSEKRKVWEDMLLVLEKLGASISEKQRGFFLSK